MMGIGLGERLFGRVLRASLLGGKPMPPAAPCDSADVSKHRGSATVPPVGCLCACAFLVLHCVLGFAVARHPYHPKRRKQFSNCPAPCPSPASFASLHY